MSIANPNAVADGPTLLDQALTLAEQGFPVFPVVVGGKRPAIGEWQLRATTDPNIITAWWRSNPNFNIGVATGAFRDGFLTVLDVDVKSGAKGLESLETLDLLAPNEGWRDGAYRVNTPSGGLHLYFFTAHPLGTTASKIASGLDTRGVGGYVVAPGSVIGDRGYEFVGGEIKPAPDWLANDIGAPRARASHAASFDTILDTPQALDRASDWVKNNAKRARVGQRGSTAYKIAAKIREFGVSREACKEILRKGWISSHCEPPMDVEDMNVSVSNAYTYGLNCIGSLDPTNDFGVVNPAEHPLPVGCEPFTPVAAVGKKTPDKDPPANLANVMKFLRTNPKVIDTFAFDEMRRDTMLQQPLPARGTDNPSNEFEGPRPVRDTDVSALQEYMQRKSLERVTKDTVHQAVDLRAQDCSYHPVRDWLSAQKWDGVSRLDSWLQHYLGCERTAYTAGIGAMFLIAMTARVFDPGCKADFMLVLEGEQGARKSTACRILGGDYFSDALPDVTGGKDVSQHLRGKWLVEIPEMSAMSKIENAALKAFITRPVEQYRPSYGRRDVVEPRQCVFVGTTNKSAYLRDETGGRRFWPVRVGVIDTVALSRDRTQLFAEALVRFRGGSLWWPDGEFEARHIRPQQDARHEADAWEQPLLEFLVQRDRTTIHELATEALHITTGKLGTIDQRRISCCLERLQWRRLPKDSHGRIPWGPIDVADHAARKAAFRKEAIKPSILVPEDEFA